MSTCLRRTFQHLVITEIDFVRVAARVVRQDSRAGEPVEQVAERLAVLDERATGGYSAGTLCPTQLCLPLRPRTLTFTG